MLELGLLDLTSVSVPDCSSPEVAMVLGPGRSNGLLSASALRTMAKFCY
jgi:hypothetical protein